MQAIHAPCWGVLYRQRLLSPPVTVALASDFTPRAARTLREGAPRSCLRLACMEAPPNSSAVHMLVACLSAQLGRKHEPLTAWCHSFVSSGTGVFLTQEPHRQLRSCSCHRPRAGRLRARLDGCGPRREFLFSLRQVHSTARPEGLSVCIQVSQETKPKVIV